MILKFKRLLGRWHLIPNPRLYPTTEISFQYVSGSAFPDKVTVFHNNKYLFRYNWIDGVDATRYGRLEEWHRRYEETNK